jgi:hypothetical protein
VNKIFIPARKPDDWKSFLAEPDKHLKTGHSAKALAYCWQEANDFPECVRKVFKKSGIGLFQNIELLLAFPEYKVVLPGGVRPSQNDIFILGRGNNQLVSMMVEGKVSEPFGETIAEWRKDKSEDKDIRLRFLLEKLGLKENEQIDTIRYQLLHRTASAIIEAKKFNAENTLMLVHSFSPSNQGFEDYGRFLSLFGGRAEIDSLALTKNINGLDLHFGWVRGEEKYLWK